MKSLGCLLICSAAALAQNALDPAAAEWKSAVPMALSLQRTPPLYPTDAPAAIEVPSVQAQFLHTNAGNFVRLEWSDKTHDTTVLPKAERAWQGDHFHKNVLRPNPVLRQIRNGSKSRPQAHGNATDTRNSLPSLDPRAAQGLEL